MSIVDRIVKRLAGLVVGLAAASEESSIWVAAEWLVSVEVLALTVNWSPFSLASTVVERQLKVSDSISLEVVILPQPSPDLLAKIVANGF